MRACVRACVWSVSHVWPIYMGLFTVNCRFDEVCKKKSSSATFQTFDNQLYMICQMYICAHMLPCVCKN